MLFGFSAAGLHLGKLRVADHPVSIATGPAAPPDRLEACLALAFDRRLRPRQRAALAVAATASRFGDQAMANIRLAQAGLSRVASTHALAARLGAATFLLDEGLAAEDLLNALDLRADSPDLAKYNRNQPRVPAGHGRASGEFGSGGMAGDVSYAAVPASAVAPAAAEMPDADEAPDAAMVPAAAAVPAVAAMPAVEAAPSFFAADVGAEALAALSTFALGLTGAAAVFGTLFVPTPNTTKVSGPLPGGDGLSYDYDRDEGVLRIRGADGQIVAGGPRDRAGIFHDADTGIAIGRDIGDGLVFDQAAMTEATDDAGAVPRAKADADADEKNEPKLCPEPTEEPRNNASKRSQLYQEQISGLVNPHRKPLPYGMAVAFFNPKSGKWVRLDECDESDGALIEAKGPGYARNLKYEHFRESYRKRFLRQATAQVQAAGGRQVRWYFAERETSDFARKLFRRDPDLIGIQVYHVEANVK